MISDVGTRISYGLSGEPDTEWESHLSQGWDTQAIRSFAMGRPGIRLQPPENQSEFKISFYIEPERFNRRAFEEAIARSKLRVNIIVTQNSHLDLLSRRASKAHAIDYLRRKLAIPARRTFVCGDSGNDLDMLTLGCPAVVVSNYSSELEELRGRPNVFFATQEAAAGILEGLRRYRFPFTTRSAKA